MLRHGSHAGAGGALITGSPAVANARAVAAALRSYFAALPPDSRRRLKALGAIIKSAAPGAVAAFSYRIPGFRLNDHALLSYAAWTHHVSLYPVTSGMKRAGGAQLRRFVVSKGTIRFPLSEPLPEALVTKLVKARVAEGRRSGSRARAARSPGAD